jgi:hypothetical protein
MMHGLENVEVIILYFQTQRTFGCDDDVDNGNNNKNNNNNNIFIIVTVFFRLWD